MSDESAEISRTGIDTLSLDDARGQLARILSRPSFQRSERMSRFLSFVTEETLEGRSNDLKEYILAIAVFDRDPSFDPSSSSLVRVEAGRLRKILAQYYLEEGKDDPLVLEIPKGAYSVRFTLARRPDSDTEAHTPPVSLPKDKPSIAVLPFEKRSTTERAPFLSEGLSDEIITNLSKFRQFYLIARNSSFNLPMRSDDHGVIGEVLGARYIIDGHVQESGNHVRVTARLVDAVTGGVVWQDRYDRALEDIFSLQDEISKAIVVSIFPAITMTELERIRHQPPETLEAWDLTTQARHCIGLAEPSQIARARELAERAVEINPTNVAALAILAEILSTAEQN